MLNNNTGYIVTISGREVLADRPEPLLTNIDLLPYKRRMDPQIAVEALTDGSYVLITDFYSSGLAILRELKIFLENNHSDQSFKGQRDFRSLFRELSQRLLLTVSNNKLSVRKAPEIGWFKILYPGLNEFLLPFPQVQGLNSSWQWYIKGITIPGLNRKIHPFFGTYFPTRFDHLTLFSTWLKRYRGERTSAYDIGIGSGILSFKLLKSGFQKVYGTDSNPNAIIGLDDYINGENLYSRIDLSHGDLFASYNHKADLIVFNPPWLPASHQLSGLDKAIYYDDDLFPRFFAEAKEHLKADGRVVFLFSNLAQITNVAKNHPVEEELAGGKGFEKEIFLQQMVEPASKKTKRNQHWRSNEMVELWVLKMINNK